MPLVITVYRISSGFLLSVSFGTLLPVHGYT
jgi:hypothetical protein